MLDFLCLKKKIFYRIFLYLIFGLACDHGNSFLCLEEGERGGYWIEVRTFFNVKTTTTTLTADGPRRARLPIPPTAMWTLMILPSLSGSRLRYDLLSQLIMPRIELRGYPLLTLVTVKLKSAYDIMYVSIKQNVMF